MKFNGYDIYGEPLQVGHCSVHPIVSMEYPCYQCYAEDDDRKAQYDAYKKHCEEIQREHEQDMYQDYVDVIKHMDGGGI